MFSINSNSFSAHYLLMHSNTIDKDKKEKVSSPSSLIYHYGSLVQSLSLQKRKKGEGKKKGRGIKCHKLSQSPRR